MKAPSANPNQGRLLKYDLLEHLKHRVNKRMWRRKGSFRPSTLAGWRGGSSPFFQANRPF